MAGRSRTIRLLTALLCAAALLGSAPSHAGPACAAGIGGTGAPGHGEAGIGGTGAVARDDGIGGTGIVGVITGFGSICVNGVEVHYDADTPVDANGEPATSNALAIGQVVAVNAAGVGADVRARSISIVLDVVGPVTHVLGNGRIQVMGQPVELDSATVLSLRAPRGRAAGGVTTGDRVQVSGLRRADGTLVASHVSSAPDTRASVTGALARRPDGGYAVHGVSIDLPPAAADRSPSGAELRVSGEWNGTTLVAREVVREPVQRVLETVQRLELQGYVDLRGAAAARIAGKTVEIAQETRILGGESGLGGGDRVRISAVVAPDKRIVSERITIEQPSGMRFERRDGVQGKTEPVDKPAPVERSEKAGKPEKGEKPEKIEKPEKMEKPEKLEKPEKPEKPEKIEKPEKVEKPEKIERVERPERRSGTDAVPPASTAGASGGNRRKG